MKLYVILNDLKRLTDMKEIAQEQITDRCGDRVLQRAMVSQHSSKTIAIMTRDEWDAFPTLQFTSLFPSPVSCRNDIATPEDIET